MNCPLSYEPSWINTSVQKCFSDLDFDLDLGKTILTQILTCDSKWLMHVIEDLFAIKSKYRSILLKILPCFWMIFQLKFAFCNNGSSNNRNPARYCHVLLFIMYRFVDCFHFGFDDVWTYFISLSNLQWQQNESHLILWTLHISINRLLFVWFS